MSVKEKTRKVQLGCLHWNEKTEKSQSVRMMKGGGSREVDMPLEATVDEITAEYVRLFFRMAQGSFMERQLAWTLAWLTLKQSQLGTP